MYISSIVATLICVQLFLNSVLAKESIAFGMEKAVLAYDLACDYEWSYSACQGKQSWLMNAILNHAEMKTEAIQAKYFGMWTKDKVLCKLPDVYQTKCEPFLADPDTKPEVDEKEELKDDDIEYPYKGYVHCLISTLREKSKDVIRRDWSLVYFGMCVVKMKKSVEAFDITCAYEVTNVACEGAQARMMKEMLINPNLKNQTKKQIKYFGTWSKQNALSKLPKIYDEKCEKYLSDPEADPPADESKELNDKGKDYFFKAYAHCLLKTLREISKGVMRREWSYVSLGMDMAVVAYDMACDYDISNYKCDGQQDLRRKKVTETPQLNNKPKSQIKHFGLWTTQNGITKLPQIYKDKCEKYLSQATVESPIDESKVLNDKGKDYPFKAYSYCLVHTLREVSKGVMKRDWKMLTLGMKNAVLAFDKACDYELTGNQCQGKQSFVKSKVLSDANLKKKPKQQLRYFGAWSKQIPLSKLSTSYKEKCEKYLDDPEAKPPADESKELGDGGKDYFFKAYAHCLIQVLRETSGGVMKRDWSMLYYGMEKATQAFNMACDYDLTNSACDGEQERIMKEMLTNSNLKNKTHMQVKYFGMWTNTNALVDLSKPYQDKCGKYLSDPDAKPPADESKVLNDKGKNYFYKAYTHCLVKVLRDISKGLMKRTEDYLLSGMKRVGRAYDMACDFDALSISCEGDQARMRKKLLDNAAIKNQPKKQIKYFEKLHVQLSLLKLPKDYKEFCEKYLKTPEAEPAVDESEEMKDKGEEYPFKAYAHCLVNTLRIISHGMMRREMSSLYLGMEQVVKAYEMACFYEYSNMKCEGRQARMMNEVLTNPSLKNQTKKQLKYFGMWSKDNALLHLPKLYQDKCGPLLSEYEAEPKSDESKELGDAGTMYFYKAYAHCLVQALRETSKGKMRRDYSVLYYGMQKSVEAFDMACDYEVLNFKCIGAQERMMNEMLNNEKLKNETKSQLMHFSQWSRQNALMRLSKAYMEKCEKFLMDPLRKYSKNESKQLKDVSTEYFFKGYAHCLLNTLRIVSKGAMKRDWSLLETGMINAVSAFDRVCIYEVSSGDCDGEQERVWNEVLAHADIMNDTKKQIKYFGLWTQHNVLSDLPKDYQDKCEKFLADPDMPPDNDESKELKDKGKKYFFRGYTHCLIHTMRIRSKGVMTRDWPQIFVGMEKSNIAYEFVCLYEKEYTEKCRGQLRTQEMILSRWEAYKNATYKLWKRYGARAIDKTMPLLPVLYLEKCQEYLEDPVAELPKGDTKLYEQFLDDKDMDYPYKAFAHCMMQTMIDKNGGKVPEVVESAQVLADAPDEG